MTIWKKAVSAATSAALLASLLATAVAPAAFAANTTTGGGTIFPDSDVSAPVTLGFAEDAVDQFSNGTFEVKVYDSHGQARVYWDTSTAPVVTRDPARPSGSASAAWVGGNKLVVTISGTSDYKLEGWTISGLKVGANSDANYGPVQFVVTSNSAGLPETLVPASGTLDDPIVGGSDTHAAVTLDEGSPAFQETGHDCSNSDLAASKITIAATSTSFAETFTAVGGTDGGDIYKASAFAASHPVGAVVTQSVCELWFPSAVTVGDAVVAYSHGDIQTLTAGVSNQESAGVRVDLGYWEDVHLLLEGDTVTFTVTTPGVTFSPNHQLFDIDTDHVDLRTPTLSPDGKSVTVALDEDANNGHHSHITFEPQYDVAGNVAAGTPVEIAVSTAAATAAYVPVVGSPVLVAYVGRLAGAAVASAPTIYIGQNDQSTGMLTITESAAGVIAYGEQLEVCLSSNEDWTTGRYFWAVVTSGNLKFNVGGLPVSQAKMTRDGDCLEVWPYSASTTASKVEIRDGSATAPVASAATAGPKVNVPNDLLPGQTYVNVYWDGRIAANAVVAMRAYTGTPVASVSGQLAVLRGVINQAAGSVTFTEGAPNQFGSHYTLGLCLVDPSAAQNSPYLWSSPIGAAAPVVTTNSVVSGLIASYRGTTIDNGCLLVDVIDQDMHGGLGTITIGNLKLDVLQDAALGPVFVRVFSDIDYEFHQEDHSSDFAAGADLLATVSPAVVIQKTALAIDANSALGNNPTAGYNDKTPKAAALGKYVTWKFTGGSALASQRVNVLVAMKVGGAWTGPAYLKSAWADANGIVTVVMKSSAAKWINVRVQWPGSSSRLISTSEALGALWK